MTDARPTAAAMTVAAPAVLLATVTLALMLLGVAGINPFWPDTNLTFAEAAALRDRATVQQFLDRGADPYLPSTIREGLISGEPLTLTPMRAAIRENRSEVVAALLARTPAERNAPLVCAWYEQAVARKSDEIPALLAARFPGEVARCSGAPKE